jgi:ferredoxin
MKTVIYYFTGTGNTLAVARELAAELGDTELIPIPALMDRPEVVADADAVGIAFPVYFLSLPGLVGDFVQKIRFSGRPFVFGIATCGELPGGALFRLRELLAANGTALSAGFAIVMPENYIGPVDMMEDPGRVQEKYAGARNRIPAIAAAIRDRKSAMPDGTGSVLLKIGGRITHAFATSVYNTPRRFHVTGTCNRCRTCERICPTRNITVGTDAVRWGRSCIQCYACIHWCPNEAIEIGGRTTGKRRYHHPDVTLADMLRQRGGP